MSNEILRASGLLVIEVVNSNPNGDPDRESDPRQRPNGLGEISPVSFKRKLRDIVDNKTGPVYKDLAKKFDLVDDDFLILETRGRDRDVIRSEINDGRFEKKYWDARVFGNTFLEEKMEKETIKTGVVQFVMGVSLCQIEIQRLTNTNKAGVESDKSRGLAPLAYRIVEHGVYVMPFYINPSVASKSGCTQKDIDVLKHIIPYAYDHTRSAIRPDVRLRHAWYIEHKNQLGSCPDHLIIDALTPRRKGDDFMAPSNSWNDYEVPTKLPDEIENRIKQISDLVN